MENDLPNNAYSHADYSRVNFRGSWRNASVTVVGLGALGSEVVRLLGSMGAGRVLLIDPDIIEPANLPFSVLFRMALAGGGPNLGKAAALARLGERIFPDTAWEAAGEEIADVPLQRLAACNLIFSATDNALARAETSLLARLLGKPMVDGGLKTVPLHAADPTGGTGAPEGRVSRFDPAAEAACYLCQLPEKRRAELLRWALAPTLGCAAQPRAAAMQGTPALASVVAGTMIEVALSALHPPAPDGQLALHAPGKRAAPGSGSHASSRGWICRVPPDSRQPAEIELSRSADCPWHALGATGMLHALDAHTPIRTALQALSAARGDGQSTVLELLWPICLEARCQACGARTQPMQRVARVRRRGCCAVCGAAGMLEPLATVASITEHDPLAARSPAELGLPDRHLFWCRARYCAEGDSAESAPPQERSR